jgi:hypothetical protein
MALDFHLHELDKSKNSPLMRVRGSPFDQLGQDVM